MCSILEPVCCSLSSSNCCFLTCIQVSQEAGQVVWYAHLFQNFLQLVVIHIKGFGIVNKAGVDVFLKLSCFFDDPTDVGNLISGEKVVFLIKILWNKYLYWKKISPTWSLDKSVKAGTVEFSEAIFRGYMEVYFYDLKIWNFFLNNTGNALIWKKRINKLLIKGHI